ncbi:MAG: tetratricopeptide repeat protein [Spirochaetales bacterium]|nr:tetratricopeptide repeat protein [Spirochaetales bacterium]
MKKIILTGVTVFIVTLSVFGQSKPDALLLYQNGDYKEAVKVCEEELSVRPGNMDSYSVLGWSLLRLGRYQDALDRAKDGLKISRYDARIVEIVGEAYFYLGKNLDALKWFEEYVALAPSGGRIDTVYFLMGELFIRMGEYNHADIAFTTAVYHAPNIARWWARLGYAREMAKDYKYSIEAYDEALKLAPSFPDAKRGKERVEAILANG